MMKRILITLIALLTLVVGNAFALTYTTTIQDTWYDWVGDDYVSGLTGDDNESVGSLPDVISMTVAVEQDYLKTVTIQFGTNRRISDSLFINNTNTFTPTNQHWDYYVIERTDNWEDETYIPFDDDNHYDTVRTDGQLAPTGFYSVNADFISGNYTKTNDKYTNRPNTPNGIDSVYLTELLLFDEETWEWDGAQRIVHDVSLFTLVYHFDGLKIDATGGLFIAYSQWCGNDVMGGHAVPEPGTVLLFGAGLVGLGFYRRFRKV